MIDHDINISVSHHPGGPTVESQKLTDYIEAISSGAFNGLFRFRELEGWNIELWARISMYEDGETPDEAAVTLHITPPTSEVSGQEMENDSGQIKCSFLERHFRLGRFQKKNKSIDKNLLRERMTSGVFAAIHDAFCDIQRAYQQISDDMKNLEKTFK